MAQHTSCTYKGFGENILETRWFSQAVRVGENIHLAGQGGWDRETGVCYPEINDQIDQTFLNIEHALQTAGGKGWSQVYRVNSFHIQLNEENQEAMVRNFKKYMPDHHFVWTCVGVTRLGAEDMRVEIEVSAYDPAGSKANDK